MSAGYAAAYQYWKQLDLPSLQKELDEKAADLANRQDDSEVSRKKLVEMCRDFKKSSPEDVKRVVTPVLRCFQSEVDSLSKRSKAAEAAFLSLYKKIIESPDPVPLLESTAQLQKKAQKVQDLEIENVNLKDTLNQYNQEFVEVKNQEITIRQLKEKVKMFEEQMESIVATKLVEKENMLIKNVEEKEKRLALNESLLQAKLSEAERRADSLEKSLFAVQQELFQLKSHSDELGNARISEIDLLMSDVEKANSRAIAAERECEMLKESIKVVKVEQNIDSLTSNSDHTSALDIELALKDRQVSQLLDELTQLKIKAEADTSENSKKVDELNEVLSQNTRLIEDLQSQLNKHADYEECKRELTILKSVYLGAQDEANSDVTNVAADPKSLEILLLEKNKALQLEKTAILSKKRDLETELEHFKNECQNLTVSNEQQARLIANLEQDLMNVQTLHLPDVDTFQPQDVSNLDLLSSVVNSADERAKYALPPAKVESLLPIVTSQRERLRQRVHELEELNLQHQQHTAILNEQLERLRGDNVKLYEKIKFLQGYQAGSEKAFYMAKSSDEVMDKYSGDYEASLDPFRRFGAQEYQRRYMALRTHDKATLSITRLIMSSGIARAIFFFYLLFLHCLVFLVLYKLAYTESCKRDAAADCLKKYREHMHLAHGLEHSAANSINP